jgi:glycosyltransferase involved in cell wall biosynthesis
MNGLQANTGPVRVDGLNMEIQSRVRRILLLTATNFYGGPERQIIGHALAVDTRRFQVIVAAFTEAGKETELVRRAREAGLLAESIHVRNAYDPRAVRNIIKLINAYDIKVVVSHNYRSNLLGRRAARANSIGHIAVSRGWTAENLKVRFFHWLDKIMLPKSDMVICVSESKRNELRSAGVPENCLSVIPNAVTVSDQLRQPSIDWREHFGWDRPVSLVVSAGRLSREKGPDIFVAAIPAILQQRPATRFILFGHGPMKESLLRQITRLGLTDTVRLAGYVGDLPRELTAFDILVNSSRSEGMPNIVLEAMAARLPVVGTSVGGVPELIEHGRTGCLVAAEDSGALARAIIELLENRTLAEQYAMAAQQKIGADYSFAAQARRFEQIYDRVGSCMTI